MTRTRLSFRRLDHEAQLFDQLPHLSIEGHDFKIAVNERPEVECSSDVDCIKSLAARKSRSTSDDLLDRRIDWLEIELIQDVRQEAQSFLDPRTLCGSPLTESCPTNGYNAFDPEQARGEPLVRAEPEISHRRGTVLNEQFRKNGTGIKVPAGQSVSPGLVQKRL
jgi:hypothetical protein